MALFLMNAASAQWHWQNPKPQGNPLRSVFFLDPVNGYAAGDLGTIIKTTNGGVTWTTICLGSSYSFKSVYFIDYNTGFITGSVFENDSTHALIMKTTDAGLSWNAIYTGSANELNSIFFPTGNIGFAVGGYYTPQSEILKTTDAGATWTTQITGFTW